MVSGKFGFWGGAAAMITGCCIVAWAEGVVKPMFESGKWWLLNEFPNCTTPRLCGVIKIAKKSIKLSEWKELYRGAATVQSVVSPNVTISSAKFHYALDY